MQEYFAQRMAQIKKTQAGRDPAASSSEVSSNAPSPLTTSASMEDSPNTSDMEQSKKKKKDRESDRDGIEEDALTSVTGESVEEPNHSKKKKKKNKRKREERDEDEDGTEVCSAPTVTDGITEEDAPTTGKRKKDKKTSLEVHSDEPKTIEIENMYPKFQIKRKRRKRENMMKRKEWLRKWCPKRTRKNRKSDLFFYNWLLSKLVTFWCHHDFNIEITKINGNEANEFTFRTGLYLHI